MVKVCGMFDNCGLMDISDRTMCIIAFGNIFWFARLFLLVWASTFFVLKIVVFQLLFESDYYIGTFFPSQKLDT